MSDEQTKVGRSRERFLTGHIKLTGPSHSRSRDHGSMSTVTCETRSAGDGRQRRELFSALQGVPRHKRDRFAPLNFGCSVDIAAKVSASAWTAASKSPFLMVSKCTELSRDMHVQGYTSEK